MEAALLEMQEELKKRIKQLPAIVISASDQRARELQEDYRKRDLDPSTEYYAGYLVGLEVALYAFKDAMQVISADYAVVSLAALDTVVVETAAAASIFMEKLKENT